MPSSQKFLPSRPIRVYVSHINGGRILKPPSVTRSVHIYQVAERVQISYLLLLMVTFDFF